MPPKQITHPLSSGGGGKLSGSPLAGPPASAGGRALSPKCWYRLQSNRCSTSRLIGGQGLFILNASPSPVISSLVQPVGIWHKPQPHAFCFSLLTHPEVEFEVLF